MTLRQARFIKKLRVKHGYSWRGIHSAYQVKYISKERWWYNLALNPFRKQWCKIIGLPEDTPDGNQINGIDLCNKAMILLGEEEEDGWN